MLIYCGNPDGEALTKCKEFGLGVMVCTSAEQRVNKGWNDIPCALDNGAFRCSQRGYPFMADSFRAQLCACFRSGVTLDFIVCPDIVCGGDRSLEFSMSWATGELITAPRLALVVQDGMTLQSVGYQHPELWFSHIFIGGSVEWKWRTAASWCNYAHDMGMKCHIGQVGTLDRLRAAKRIGADSVDSTSFARNGSWHIIEEFMASRQSELAL